MVKSFSVCTLCLAAAKLSESLKLGIQSYGSGRELFVYNFFLFYIIGEWGL